MAKRTNPSGPVHIQQPTVNAQLIQVDTTKFIAKTPLTTNPNIYSNYVQFNINPNEITIDFYELSSNPAQMAAPNTKHLQRVFIPAGLGKGFVSALANIIDIVEKDSGVVLPNSREKTESDVFEIWK